MMAPIKNNSKRHIVHSKIISLKEVARNIFVLRFHSPELAASTLPGQFINIKISSGFKPLLRRPFSIYRVEGDDLEIVFNAVGLGTKILSGKKAGDEVDILGPLGESYNVRDEFDTAILAAGGLGVAPLPILTGAVRKSSKQIVTFLGARTADQLVTDHLHKVSVATDDGSRGFHGTVVDLLAETLRQNAFPRPKIFACGPNPMLRNISHLATSLGIPCEVSLESVMACGFGICQGCPVERNHRAYGDGNRKKYYLVCKDGPVFLTRDILIE